MDEVELGGLEEEVDEKTLFGSVDTEYHLFEREEVDSCSPNLVMDHQASICYLISLPCLSVS